MLWGILCCPQYLDEKIVGFICCLFVTTFLQQDMGKHTDTRIGWVTTPSCFPVPCHPVLPLMYIDLRRILTTYLLLPLMDFLKLLFNYIYFHYYLRVGGFFPPNLCACITNLSQLSELSVRKTQVNEDRTIDLTIFYHLQMLLTFKTPFLVHLVTKGAHSVESHNSLCLHSPAQWCSTNQPQVSIQISNTKTKKPCPWAKTVKTIFIPVLHLYSAWWEILPSLNDFFGSLESGHNVNDAYLHPYKYIHI